MIESLRRLSLCAALCGFLGLAATAVHAQTATYQFDLPAQPLADALRAVGRQTSKNILFDPALVEGISVPALRAELTVSDALRQLLTGTRLSTQEISTETVLIRNGTRDTAKKPVASKTTAVQGTNGDLHLAQADPSAQDERSESRNSDNSSRASTEAEKNRIVLDEIVVTGTHLRNSQPITPVITITNEDFIKQGYTRLDQALEQLPQNFKGAVAQDTNSITAAGSGSSENYSFSSGVNLRGLGASATLVLLNGRRLAPTALGGSVDISQVPVSAIDRVEVLTDGASATYGSDAVAGVVNIITKKEVSGVETGIRSTGISDGKDPNYGATLTSGINWDVGGLVANVDYEKDNELLARERPFTSRLPNPTNLLPKQETISTYLSLHQSVTDGFTLSGDILASRRKYSANSSLFGRNVLSGESEQLHGAVQADYAFASGWNLALVGQYGEERSNSTSTRSRSGMDFTYGTPGFEARIDGALFQLPGGAVRAAVGASGRREIFKAKYVNASSGNSDDSRRVESAYGEIQIPLVGEQNKLPLISELRLNIAGRYDDYSDFGSASTPKFGLRWALSDQLALHASYGESFKAPTLYSLDTGSFYVAYVYPVTDPSSASGTSPAILFDGANPDLTAERAQSVNVGVTFTPTWVPGLTADISYFSIDYDERILQLTSEGFVDNVLEEASLLGSLITLNPSLAQVEDVLANSGRTIYDYTTDGYAPEDIRAIANIGYVNVGSSRLRGLDGNVRYVRDTRWGQASLDVSATYVDTLDNQILPTTPEFSILNTIYNPLRLRARMNVGLSRNAWSANARVNYANAYYNDNDPGCASPGCTVSSWTTLDVSASYAPGDLSGGSLLSGVRLGIDVSNVFDREPPFAYQARGFNYDATNASAMGRAIAVSVYKRWR